MAPGFPGTQSKGGSGNPNHFPPARLTSCRCLGMSMAPCHLQTKHPCSSPWCLRTSSFILGLTQTLVHIPQPWCLCSGWDWNAVSPILTPAPIPPPPWPSLTPPVGQLCPSRAHLLGTPSPFYLDRNHRQPCLLFPREVGGPWRARLSEREQSGTQKGHVAEGPAQVKAQQLRISLTRAEGRERMREVLKSAGREQ